ncbi:hypothetical protein GCM10011575_23040 [Microlunatus endophyticus]|uniref:Glucanase n=1 Tax=Microlunatus endophyticus TaxID=1716077 RepID=A0A917SA33_9ACTN|nr:glycoside hydrolase family 6 protein [Microlunatus endophyticus]GGL63994.1 hypothetical protein GCM10011575_23040 [Microlunatus endophyticus]
MTTRMITRTMITRAVKRGGSALAAAALAAGVLAVGAAPSNAVSSACAAEAAKMPAPWHSTANYDWASPANRYTKASMYVPPYPKAQAAADQAQASGNTAEAKRLRAIAAQPRAVWFTDGSMSSSALTTAVADVVSAARSKGEVATLVMYAIPLRDCGGYSEGGAKSASAYRSWIKAFRAGLVKGGVASGPGVSVIVEPDALALLGNLPENRRTERMDLIRTAVRNLAWTPKTSAYIDAGTHGWVSTSTMISRLSKSGLGMARGFSLDVANFNAEKGEESYGNQMIGRLGWKHYVVDTSRNGNGANGESCNPSGRALGHKPVADPKGKTGSIDAYVWVKPPGESDGSCAKGDPAAGEFFPSYANELAVNAGWYVA